MKLNLFTLDKLNNYPLINGVIIHPLKVNRDSRGILVETLKKDWKDIYGEKLPFSQSYYSITDPGLARDIDRWHYHPNQIDRFVVIKGDVVFVLYDWRKKSLTYKYMNWFKMGESNGNNGQYLLLIPVNVLHCFMVISKKPAIIMNFPTRLYDPKEEGRIPFKDVKLWDNKTTFSWDIVRLHLRGGT